MSTSFGCGDASGSFWNELDELRRRALDQERVVELLHEDQMTTPSSTHSGLGLPASSVVASDDSVRESVLRSIETVITKLIKSLADGESPSISFTRRNTWDNVSLDHNQSLQLVSHPSLTTVSFDSLTSAKKLSLVLRVLSIIYTHVQRNTYCTKRDIYYQDVQLFGRQTSLDTIVGDISLLLGVPRWQLHILATSKGLIAGDLQFADSDGRHVDCAQTDTGILIPSYVQGITNLRSNARFVLVVEKDATFQQLLGDRITTSLGPCIIITGKGFPDVNTRMLLRLLWNTFKLPTLALVDADPHGVEIMSVYKFGSRHHCVGVESMCGEGDRLTVPAMKWLGVLPSDIDRMHILPASLLPMTPADVSKARDLLQRPYIIQQPNWKVEIELMLRSEKKAEIQCLYSVSHHFLTDVYIPTKIRLAGWI